MSGEFIEGDPFDPSDIDAAEERAATVVGEKSDEARRALEYRQRAYRRLFAGTPQDGDVDAVMRDLATFCRAHQTAFHPDPRTHALLEGRREVFYRIADHVGLSLDTLFTKYHEARK